MLIPGRANDETPGQPAEREGTAPGVGAVGSTPRRRDPDGPSHSTRSGDQISHLLDRLKTEIGATGFERYLGRGARFEIDEAGLCITVPTRYDADMIDDRIGAAIRRVLTGIGRGEGESVRYEISPARNGVTHGNGTPAPTRGGPGSTATGPTPGQRRQSRRNARADSFTMEEYIVGRCNRLAFEAARRVAESDDPGLSCPLFLYGPSGVGKTHLLSAIAGRYRQVHHGARVRKVTAEDFTNEYITAVRTSTIEAFHRAYRRVELLCIDDVHFFARKSGTQNELLHTFDALDLGGARVVLASDDHPRQIRQLSSALISRFVSGSLARIEPPDPSTRRKLIRHFADRAGLQVDDTTVRFLADQAHDPDGTAPSVRDLVGMVNRIRAYLALVPGGRTSKVDPAMVSAALRESGHDDAGESTSGELNRPVPIAGIVDSVCKGLGVTREDLGGSGRHKSVVLARAMVALLARRLTRRSYPEIAAAIGLRNHSTVITAHRRIEAQIGRGETVAVGAACDGLPVSVLAERLERALRRGA